MIVLSYMGVYFQVGHNCAVIYGGLPPSRSRLCCHIWGITSRLVMIVLSFMGDYFQVGHDFAVINGGLPPGRSRLCCHIWGITSK